MYFLFSSVVIEKVIIILRGSDGKIFDGIFFFFIILVSQIYIYILCSSMHFYRK